MNLAPPFLKVDWKSWKSWLSAPLTTFFKGGGGRFWLHLFSQVMKGGGG